MVTRAENAPALEEVADTIGWLFTVCSGVLPVTVRNEYQPPGPVIAVGRRPRC
jgi:hypothetical protein